MPAGSLFEVGTGTDSERIRKKLTALCSRKTKNDILEQEKRRHRDENTNDWICIYHDSLFLDDRLQRCWGWRRQYHISFSEPSQLAGVRLDFQKGEVTASYKGLAFSVPQTALPAKSILYQFILAADQLAEESTLQGTSKDGGMVLSGDLEAGSYELTMTAEGIPAIFSMKNQNAVLTFHDFVSNGAISESEMPAESELQTTEPALQTELTELETTLESQE